jgi:two-component system sensor histidine kinase BaeS
MHPVDITTLLQTSMDSLRHRAEEKGIDVRAKLDETPVMVSGDEQRLRQLLRILFENSVSYTDAPGVIEVALDTQDGEICLQISDTPPGVPAEECEKLFDRLYRRESSRNRKSGGSGLGLAIARNIAQAQGGAISASPSHSGGLSLQVRLPVLS